MFGHRAILRLIGMLLVLASILHAARFYLEMPAISIDGAFQTYNAVSAYARGEILGIDFQSYLGAVMPLVIVPAFLIFGKTVFASTFSALLLCCAGFYITAVVLLRLTTTLAKRDAALWAMAATFVAIAGMRFSSQLILPGVSLKPLRFALPFAAALPIWALLDRIQRDADTGRTPLTASAALGPIIAIMALWSNDAGIPCLIAAIAVHAMLCLRMLDIGRAAAAIGATIASTAICAIIIVLLLTHGTPGGWLSYTFVALPADQPWFFAPWAPHHRIFAIGDSLNILRMPTGWTIAICGVTACIAAYRLWMRRGEAVPTAMVAFIYAAATGIGLLPQLAGHLENNYGIGTILPALFAPLWLVRPLGMVATGWLVPRWREPAVCLLALLTLASLTASIHSRIRKNLQYSPTIGAYVDPKEAATIAVVERARPMLTRIAPDPKGRVLSTYHSAISIAAQAESPTRYASIIHVLGDDARRDYLAKLRSTDFALVTTINPDFSGWVGWNLRASWFAMKPIIQGYEPFAQSVQHIFWKRRETPLPPPSALSCTISPIGNGAVELVLSDAVGTAAAADGRWYVDIDAMLSTAPKRYWMATESIDPAETAAMAARKQQTWIDYPNYGLPPQRQLGMMAEHRTGTPTRIRLTALPEQPIVPTGRCAATRIAPIPAYDGLPNLDDRVLRDALAPRLRRS